MSEALQTAPRAAYGSVVPWFIRLIEASPLSPAWTAVCIGAGIILTHLGVISLSSGAIPIDRSVVRLILQFSMLNAYTIWAAHFVAAGAVRVLADLRPVLRGGAEAHTRIVRSMIHVRPAEYILPAVVGIGTTSVAFFPADDTAPRPKLDRGAITMRHLAFRVDQASFGEVQAEMQRRAIPFEFQDHDIAHSIYFEDPDGHRLEITTYLVAV